MRGSPPPKGSPGRILVADDDPVSLRMLESLLRGWGYDVIVSSNGRDAWEVWRATPSLRLALLDWMMPELDGLALCRKIREEEKDRGMAYIIILTARGKREDVVQGLKAGANDFITKPFDREELRTRIDIGRRMVDLQSQLEDRVRDLEKAIQEIRTLQGMIPICMYCHKVRDDRRSWTRLEEYVASHSEARFSHGICPECMKKHYPENE